MNQYVFRAKSLKSGSLKSASEYSYDDDAQPREGDKINRTPKKKKNTQELRDEFLEELEEENFKLEQELNDLIKSKAISNNSSPYKEKLEASFGKRTPSPKKEMDQTVIEKDIDSDMYTFTLSKGIKAQNLSFSEVDLEQSLQVRPVSKQLQIEEGMEQRSLRYNELGISPTGISSSKGRTNSFNKDDDRNGRRTFKSEIPKLISPKDVSCKHDFNSSAKKHTQEKLNQEKEEKIKSLEMRLAGTLKALRTAEKALQERNSKIKELEKLVEKKTKQVDSLQHQIITSQSTPFSRSRSEVFDKSIINAKKKEKSLERQLKDQEVLISENKKYMARLQELNSKLLSQIKELEKNQRLTFETSERNTALLNKVEEYEKKLDYFENSLNEREKAILTANAMIDKLKAELSDSMYRFSNLESKHNGLRSLFNELKLAIC